MFSGSWSALPGPSSPAPSSGWGSGGGSGTWGSGGGGSTGTWGSGGGSSSTGIWGSVAPVSSLSVSGDFGTWGAAVQSPSGAPAAAYFNPGALFGGYALPAPGRAAIGAIGEGGPYTELDYPEMRFLKAGENPTELLTSLRRQQIGKPTLAGWAVLALITIAALKGGK